MVKKAVAPVKKAAAAAAKSAPSKATTKSAAAPPPKGAAKAAPAKAVSAKAAPGKSPAAKSPPAKPTKAVASVPPAKPTPKSTVTQKTATARPPAPEPPKESVKNTTSASASKSVTHSEPSTNGDAKKAAAPAKKAPAPTAAPSLPPVKGETKEGVKFTKDFDAKFLLSQRKLLIEARESLTGQAVRLEDEANSLIDDEMGDVQFDDESGEGDTMVVERERDLFLSARARQEIEEIDNALARLANGTYGYSVISMKPIPRERLEAIPWATELTEEKVGGIGRR
jgi:RNA polymerase-binding transcription factor DksA